MTNLAMLSRDELHKALPLLMVCAAHAAGQGEAEPDPVVAAGLGPRGPFRDAAIQAWAGTLDTRASVIGVVFSLFREHSGRVRRAAA